MANDNDTRRQVRDMAAAGDPMAAMAWGLLELAYAVNGHAKTTTAAVEASSRRICNRLDALAGRLPAEPNEGEK